MNKIYLILILSLILFTNASTIADSNSLRTTLEKSWYAFLDSHKTGKESELQKTMSSYSLAFMKNGLISSQLKLTPDFIKNMGKFIPDITTYKFLKVFKNGPTAGLLYEKQTAEVNIDGKEQINYFFIKFVEEKNIWKVDRVSDTSKPKFNDNGERVEFTEADLSYDFKIDGIVRNPPNLLSAPYRKAYLDVYSKNHITNVQINGINQRDTVYTSSSGTIIGGLKKGSNNILIFVSNTENKSTTGLSITIRQILKDRSTKEVFIFKPKESSEGTFSFNFNVD